jgi:lysophospholipase L1-like esterase
MKRIAFGVLGLVLAAVLCAAAYLHYLSGARNDPAFFESAILAFEKSDREAMPEAGGIVFVGSSSIRFWSTLEEDMAPLPVLNRGFGGAHFLHVVHNADRAVLAYAPKAIVVYAGDNDIASGTSVEDVVSGFRAFVARVHGRLHEAEIYYLPIKPSKLRWDLWPEMSQVNAEIEALTRQDARLHTIDVATPLLDAQGEPRDDVFIVDGLHLNETGYAAWTEVVAPVLRAAWARWGAEEQPPDP